MKNSPYSNMKQILLILAVVALVGCGKKEASKPQVKAKALQTTEKPDKELTEEEKKLIGEYERKSKDGVTSKYVLLKNGAFEGYRGDDKAMQLWLDSKWKIVDGEIRVKIVSIREWVWRINEDGSITYIAEIWKDGQNKERTDVSKEEQSTYIKIK